MCMRACKRAPEATETDHAAPPHPPLCSAAGIVSTNSLYPDEFTPDGAGEPRWGTRVGPGVVAQVRAPAARTHPLARCTSPHACTAWLRASAMPAAVSCATAAAKPPCGRAPHPHLAPPPPPPPPSPPPAWPQVHQHFFCVRLDPAVDCPEGGKNLQVGAGWAGLGSLGGLVGLGVAAHVAVRGLQAHLVSPSPHHRNCPFGACMHMHKRLNA